MHFRKAFLGLAVLAIALIGGLTFVSAPTAVTAAANDGATVVNDTQCFPAGGGYQFCVQQKAVFNYTTSASGNVVSIGDGTYTFSYVDPTGSVLSSSTQRYHYVVVVKDGVTQVIGNRYSGSFQSGTTTCTFSGRFHYANGSVQYSDSSFVCS